MKYLNIVPLARLNAAMADLAFDWREPGQLSKGQLKVVMKRMRQASHKTMDDMNLEAENSPTIQSMRRSLAKLQRGLRDA